jgi:hypothetical protein
MHLPHAFKLALWLLVAGLLTLSAQAQNDSIWNLQAVDADGQGTHPKVGAEIIESNKVHVEGIALNAPGEILNPAQMWQVYIQGESPDKGGIAAFAAVFYNGSNWPKYPSDIEPGDRVRVEGYVANNRGKVNINERHSAAPELAMTVTILEKGVGLPTPEMLTSLTDLNIFDVSRSVGGEKYQCQWVELDGVHIASGIWAAGESLILSDDEDSTFTMLLAAPGDFGDHPQPAGQFSVRGIFDQEAGTGSNPAPPFTDGYRLWVKSFADFIIPNAVDGNLWDLYE